MNKIMFIVTIIILTLSACAAQTPPPPTVDVQGTAFAQAWLSVTQTQLASWTATPTKTPIPTRTPVPTNTSTPEPQPFILSGSGDAIVDVSKWDGPAVMHAKYGSGGNFAVINYGPNNEKQDLLINTIGAYDGIVPIDFLDKESTVRLEVKASGPWEFTISPLASSRKFDLPNVITGNGDDIVITQGGNADLIKADNSQGDSNFAVWSYGPEGRDLIFNEIAPYTGTALLNPDTWVLVVKATGNWSLDITTK